MATGAQGSEVSEVVRVVDAGDGRLVVSAKAVHAGLVVGRDFSNWLRDRIRRYSFEEGVDYWVSEGCVSFDSPVLANQRSSSRGGDRKSQDYWLSLGMAKELAMVERSEAGRRTRKYFLECERQLLEKVESEKREALELVKAEAAKLESRLEKLKGRGGLMLDARWVERFEEFQRVFEEGGIGGQMDAMLDTVATRHLARAVLRDLSREMDLSADEMNRASVLETLYVEDYVKARARIRRLVKDVDLATFIRYGRLSEEFFDLSDAVMFRALAGMSGR